MNYPLNQPPDLYTNSIKELLSECREEMKISYDNRLGCKIFYFYKIHFFSKT